MNAKPPLATALKAGAVVFGLIVAAKIFNFLKKIMIGNLFGISWQADSFFAASYLPYYVAVFFEGVIYLGFIPLFSRALAEKGREAAARFAGEILPGLLLLTGMLVLCACLTAPWLVREIVPGFKAGNQALTQNLFCIMSLVVIFITLSSFFQSLNSFFGHYLAAASSGMTDSAIMIGVTLATFGVFGIHAAAWASVAGAFVAFALQVFYLRRSGSFLPLRWGVRLETFLQLLKILVPLGIIWVFQMIPLVVVNRFGSGMWQGTISAITISLGIMIVPTGLVSQTVLISIFPSLAKKAGEIDREGVHEIFFQTLRAAFFILIPAGFLLSGLAGPIAILFFGGNGGFAEGTLRISKSLFCLGWCAFAFYADLFMTQSLITIRKTVPAILLCGTRAVLTVLFSYFLSGVLDYQGLAVSFSLGLAVNFFLFFPLLFRLTPLVGRWKELALHGFQLFLAAAPLLLGHWIFTSRPFAAWIAWPKVQILAAAAAFSLLGLCFYFAVLYRVRLKEARSISETLKKIWAQKSWWITDTGEV